jgi:hypothetical protein
MNISTNESPFHLLTQNVASPQHLLKTQQLRASIGKVIDRDGRISVFSGNEKIRNRLSSVGTAVRKMWTMLFREDRR